MSYKHVTDLFEGERVVLLDGGFGTELIRRHVEGADDPNIWSAGGLLRSPRTVLDIHRDYLLAGADVITAGAFRTNSRALRKAGLDGIARSLTHFAVSLAREMRYSRIAPHEFAIAGNAASLENCYRPDLSPGLGAYGEHAEKVEYLEAAGADFLLFESIPKMTEALAALEAASKSTLPVWLSLVLKDLGDQNSQPQLLDDTLVADIPKWLLQAPRQPDVLLFNCCTPESITAALPVLASKYSGVFGAYANVEAEYYRGKPWIRRVEITSQVYADMVRRWIADGARVVGGCCGTTPEDIRCLRDMIDESAVASPEGVSRRRTFTRRPERAIRAKPASNRKKTPRERVIR